VHKKVSEELSADLRDDSGELGEVLLVVAGSGRLIFTFTLSK
jgi:hypothetical protein